MGSILHLIQLSQFGSCKVDFSMFFFLPNFRMTSFLFLVLLCLVVPGMAGPVCISKCKLTFICDLIIIPDILSLKMTRAFWRQNTFTFNKPVPLGAKNTLSISLEVLLPFLFFIRFSGSDQPILLCI